MTLTLARGGAKSDRHTTRHADQVEPPQAVMVGPTQAVRTTEVNVPQLDGYTFTGVEFAPETLTVQGGETVQVAAVNTYKQGGLAVTGGTAATGAVIVGVSASAGR
jgi:hypothetical protein